MYDVNILKDLNDQQREAVLQTEGPVLILAGAGSGKTRALTYRVAYLIQEKKIRGENILAVTFTNKAADVMKGRIAKLLSPLNTKYLILNTATALPWLGTFHSICVKILRREAHQIGISNRFTIYDEDDSRRAIKLAMKNLGLVEKKFNPRAIKSYISGAKGELVSARGYLTFALDYFQKIVAKVYLEYEKILEKANALDFDDLLSKTVKLFEKNPQTLSKYQEKFKYILIDEYQDTNHAQYILIKLLSRARRNIFAIGDDWQSIYSFRGAKFQNILDFKKDYPEAKIIYLEENYRSSGAILDAAQKMLKNNELRSDKNLFTKGSRGAPVVVAASRDKMSEVEFILDEISALRVGENLTFCDFVILYRTNAQSRAFEEKLIERGIPYRIIGSVRFYERKEIKDILAYLNYILNSADLVSLERIINFPPRGLGEKTVEKILTLGDAKAREQIPKYREFAALIDKLRLESASLSPGVLVEKIIEKTGYKEYLSDGTFESETRLENIEELKSSASQYQTLEDFLEKVALVADIDNYNEKEDALTLMTVHSAKGMEFPVVFITGLEEGLFPHVQSLDSQFDLEEERRLFYVGMTRAMRRLYISYSQFRIAYGRLEESLPSRFIGELPESEIEFIEL